MAMCGSPYRQLPHKHLDLHGLLGWKIAQADAHEGLWFGIVAIQAGCLDESYCKYMLTSFGF
jgi:hypothetical protein